MMLVERSCQALPTIPNNMPTIALRFASAYPDERTTNAPIQIIPTSLAPSIAPRCRPESVLRCATFAQIDSSTTLEISVLRGLANGNGGLTISKFDVSIQPQPVPNSLT